MTISIKSPTSTTSKIQQNGSDVLTVDSSNNVTVTNNLSVSGTVSSTGAITFDGGVSGNVNFDSGTLYVDATNNRVGIGTSSPTQNLQIYNNGATSGQIHITNTSTGATASDGVLFGYDGSNDVIINNQEATTTKFYTNAAERMRITNSGSVGIGTSSPSGKLDVVGDIYWGSQGNGRIFSDQNWGCIFRADRASPNVADFMWQNASNTERMRIYTNGNVGITNSLDFVGGAATVRIHMAGGTPTNSNTGIAAAWNVHSDYRLKENISNISNASNLIKNLRPVNFSWVEDNSNIPTTQGFIAHELQEQAPFSVLGEKDSMRTEEYEVTPAVLDDDGNVVTRAIRGTREVPVYQAADYSKLVPLLTAALQEAITKIEDLETRIQALENPS